MSICVTLFVAFGSHRIDTETDPPQRALRMESSASFFASFVLFVPACPSDADRSFVVR